MKLLRTTKTHKNYWLRREIDWNQAYMSPEAINHPHRKLLVSVLKTFPWISLIEIGCATGANLVNIVKYIGGKQVGGVDINPEAIEIAQSSFGSGTFFKVNSADDMFMSDNSTDVILSDMALIYVSPLDIKRYLREIKRVSRNYIVLCEFHSDKWWKRLSLKWKTGYNAYNWSKLLEKEGFYDIVYYKLTEEDWPNGEPQKTFGYIFLAKIPNKI